MPVSAPQSIQATDSLEFGFRGKYNLTIKAIPNLEATQITPEGNLRFFNYENTLISELSLSTVLALANHVHPDLPGGEGSFGSATEETEGVGRIATSGEVQQAVEAMGTEAEGADEQFAWVTPDTLFYALTLFSERLRDSDDELYISGGSGAKLLSGITVPTAETGDNGDFYFHYYNAGVSEEIDMYGPKFGGAWSLPRTLRGPQGAPGAPGKSVPPVLATTTSTIDPAQSRTGLLAVSSTTWLVPGQVLAMTGEDGTNYGTIRVTAVDVDYGFISYIYQGRGAEGDDLPVPAGVSLVHGGTPGAPAKVEEFVRTNDARLVRAEREGWLTMPTYRQGAGNPNIFLIAELIPSFSQLHDNTIIELKYGGFLASQKSYLRLRFSFAEGLIPYWNIEESYASFALEGWIVPETGIYRIYGRYLTEEGEAQVRIGSNLATVFPNFPPVYGINPRGNIVFSSQSPGKVLWGLRNGINYSDYITEIRNALKAIQLFLTDPRKFLPEDLPRLNKVFRHMDTGELGILSRAAERQYEGEQIGVVLGEDPTAPKPPRIVRPMPDVTVTLGSNKKPFPLLVIGSQRTFEDDDGGPLTYTARVLPPGYAADIAPLQGRYRAIAQPTGAVTITGEWPVVVRARNPRTNLWVEMTFKYIVVGQNRAPIAPTVETKRVPRSQGLTYTLPPFTDPDGDPLTHSHQMLTDGIDVSINLSTLQIFIPIDQPVGTYQALYAAQDPSGEAANVQYAIIVEEDEVTPPTAFAVTQPDYDCVTGEISFNCVGLVANDSEQPEFSAPGVTGWTTVRKHTLEAGVRLDPNSQPITINGRYKGLTSSFTFDFRAYCSGLPQPPELGKPVPPTYAPITVTVGQPVDYTFAPFTMPAGALSMWYGFEDLPQGLGITSIENRRMQGATQDIGDSSVKITATAVFPGNRTTQASAVLGITSTAVASSLKMLAPTVVGNILTIQVADALKLTDVQYQMNGGGFGNSPVFDITGLQTVTLEAKEGDTVVGGVYTPATGKTAIIDLYWNHLANGNSRNLLIRAQANRKLAAGAEVQINYANPAAGFGMPASQTTGWIRMNDGSAVGAAEHYSFSVADQLYTNVTITVRPADQPDDVGVRLTVNINSAYPSTNPSGGSTNRAENDPLRQPPTTEGTFQAYGDTTQTEETGTIN